jgi:uncharacterized protein
METLDATAPRILPVRRPSLRFSDVSGSWTPAAPELTAVANAVSLAMPYVEPFVVTSVRSVLGDLEPELAARARAYAAQESAHHTVHRRFNDELRASGRGVAPIERALSAFYRRLGRCSTAFRVAYAAAFESVAFAAARWVDPRVDRLFLGADREPSHLFLWHLAEEAEHRGVAHDVMRSLGVKRRTHLGALVLSLCALAVFTFAGTVVFLVRQRRFWNPWSWLRIIAWTLSFLFVALPMCATSLSRTHHPDQLSDPSSLRWWLARYDESTGTLPDWDAVG